MVKRTASKKLIVILLCLTACKGGSYYNDQEIALNNSYSCQGWDGNVLDNGKAYGVEVGKLDMCRKIAVVELESDCVINFSIDVNSGKATLVLVDPSSNVKVLKKVTAQSGDGYNGNIDVHCTKGHNVIKIVYKGYSGSFKISRQGGKAGCLNMMIPWRGCIKGCIKV